jgi:hypothetical protein
VIFPFIKMAKFAPEFRLKRAWGNKSGRVPLSILNMTTTNGTGLKSAAARLRELLARKKILVCPGVYDGFTARIALREGFDCLYMVSLFYAAT